MGAFSINFIWTFLLFAFFVSHSFAKTRQASSSLQYDSKTCRQYNIKKTDNSLIQQTPCPKPLGVTTSEAVNDIQAQVEQVEVQLTSTSKAFITAKESIVEQMKLKYFARLSAKLRQSQILALHLGVHPTADISKIKSTCSDSSYSEIVDKILRHSRPLTPPVSPKKSEVENFYKKTFIALLEFNRIKSLINQLKKKKNILARDRLIISDLNARMQLMAQIYPILSYVSKDGRQGLHLANLSEEYLLSALNIPHDLIMIARFQTAPNIDKLLQLPENNFEHSISSDSHRVYRKSASNYYQTIYQQILNNYDTLKKDQKKYTLKFRKLSEFEDRVKEFSKKMVQESFDAIGELCKLSSCDVFKIAPSSTSDVVASISNMQIKRSLEQFICSKCQLGKLGAQKYSLKTQLALAGTTVGLAVGCAYSGTLPICLSSITATGTDFYVSYQNYQVSDDNLRLSSLVAHNTSLMGAKKDQEILLQRLNKTQLAKRFDQLMLGLSVGSGVFDIVGSGKYLAKGLSKSQKLTPIGPDDTDLAPYINNFFHMKMHKSCSSCKVGNLQFKSIAYGKNGLSQYRGFHVASSLSYLKNINDYISKNFGASLGNRFKSIMMNKLSKDRQLSFFLESTYLDYKTNRHVFTFMPEAFHKRLLKIMQESLNEFGDELESIPGLIQALEKRGMKLPREWMRIGTGPCADCANFAARVAQDVPGDDLIISFSKAKVAGAKILKRIQNYEKLISNSFNLKSKMFEYHPGRLRHFLSLDAIVILRQETHIPTIIKRFRDRFKIDLTDGQAKILVDYYRETNKFSAELVLKEKVNINFRGKHGVISGDAISMGAEGHRQLLHHLDSSESVEFNINQARIAIEKTAKQMDKRSKSFTSFLRRLKILKNTQSAIDSGDDIVARLKKAVTLARRSSLFDSLVGHISRSEHVQSYRMVDVPGVYVDRPKIQLSTEKINNHIVDMEAVIKKFTRLCEERGFFNKCNKLTIAGEVRPHANGVTDISLIVGGEVPTTGDFNISMVGSLYQEAIDSAVSSGIQNPGVIQNAGVRIVQSN
ncbi:MAG: hypothetical protein ISR65_14840 [Bacteriovoracaceae bacterium]|nr:hypothetical protein [Bacteriovoracaceae bacterium]